MQPEVVSQIGFFKYLPTTCSKMPVQSKPIKHIMPESDEQVQREVEERTGTCLCIWHIKVVHKVLEGGNIITIVATGSGKSFTY